MGRLDIQNKPMVKKRFSNPVRSKFPKAHDDRLTLSLKREGVLFHQARSLHLESAVRSILVSA